jgi:hypothetical protein
MSDKKLSDFTFNTSNMTMTIAFLGIYLASYAVNGLLFKDTGGEVGAYANKESIGELMALFFVFLIGLIYYLSLSPENKQTAFQDIWDWTKDYAMNPYSLMQIGIFIVLFYGFTAILRIPEASPTKAIILLIVLGGIQFMQYVLGADVFDLITGLFGTTDEQTDEEESEDEPDINTGIMDSSGNKDEVYNISNNLYSYEDAQAACKSLGARLATYNEIEDAYNNGAEWTSYGWSEGQHAYFPTQKATWESLQKVKGHEHDLGRPGVNGGYFDNPEIKFGANCYGVKPPISDADKALMEAKKNRIYPQSPEDQLLDQKVAFFQANKDKMMVLSSYNNNKWSRV